VETVSRREKVYRECPKLRGLKQNVSKGFGSDVTRPVGVTEKKRESGGGVKPPQVGKLAVIFLAALQGLPGCCRRGTRH
jgi:hypothetical protein